MRRRAFLKAKAARRLAFDFDIERDGGIQVEGEPVKRCWRSFAQFKFELANVLPRAARFDRSKVQRRLNHVPIDLNGLFRPNDIGHDRRLQPNLRQACKKIGNRRRLEKLQVGPCGSDGPLPFAATTGDAAFSGRLHGLDVLAALLANAQRDAAPAEISLRRLEIGGDELLRFRVACPVPPQKREARTANSVIDLGSAHSSSVSALESFMAFRLRDPDQPVSAQIDPNAPGCYRLPIQEQPAGDSAHAHAV